jgi:hypothetical protein
VNICRRFRYEQTRNSKKDWRGNSTDCMLAPAFTMDRLTIFGLFAVTAMLVCYALEDRSPWFVLGFAIACLLGSAYGFLQGAWPFGLVEAVWSVVAARRWWRKNKPAASPSGK